MTNEENAIQQLLHDAFLNENDEVVFTLEEFRYAMAMVDIIPFIGVS